MEKRTLSALLLSILASPARKGIWNTLFNDPGDIAASMDRAGIGVQEHIAEHYGSDPEKAAWKIYCRCRESKFDIVTLWDDDYPALLREIYRPPVVLYRRGSFPLHKPVSIVGTRASDSRSEQITRYIASSLAEQGYTVVSGLALGIDRAAHLGALNAGGATAAVLPNGPDIIYPYRNRELFRMIEESDVSGFISEYPPGIVPGRKWTFARRNRIISGVSGAVILSQAPLKSGAMITARYALEQNRDLFVCPGHSFDKSYEGCHALLRDGAAVIGTMEDLLGGLNPDYKVTVKDEITGTPGRGADAGTEECNKNSPDLNLSESEKMIFEHIAEEGTDIDKTIRMSGIPAAEAGHTVTMMEIAGIITRRGNILFRNN